MNLTTELANDIWGSPQFQADYSRLERARLLSDLHRSRLVELDVEMEDAAVSRLLQSALIFSSTGIEQFSEAAQRISTATASFLTLTDDAVKDIFSVIQARLRNFPALMIGEAKASAPTAAPLGLQYEFEAAKKAQTVILGDRERVLTPFQLASWNTLAAGKSTTLSAPTSAGKSYVLMMYLIDRYRQDKSSVYVYVVPTRALINQVSQDVTAALLEADVRDVNVTTIPIDLRIGDDVSKNLYVLTQERLEALLIAVPDLKIDGVIVDEAQILSDGSRGVLLESVIDRILSRCPQAQFVFSGPLIDNPAFFADAFALNNYTPCTTRQSPVTQNVIHLDYNTAPRSSVGVRMVNFENGQEIARIDVPHILAAESDRLSYLSYLFGRGGSSIVYVNGKAEAETISIKIANEMPSDPAVAADLKELISFVRTHIHKDYALVGTLEKGVGYHYGHMPSLLRKTLEEHFKARRISFLVCTSTLLYGLNLPAKNIFMQKPTTGRGVAIEGSDFWNLAGRAGRLGQEMEGNVYLINYADWKTEPISEKRDVSVTSALKTTLVEQAGRLLEFLADTSRPSEQSPDIEIAVGKLISDHRNSRLDRTLDRYRKDDTAQVLNDIGAQIERISLEIDIPADVIDKNIGVSVFRQKSLLDYMVKRLKQLKPEELIPALPLADFLVANKSYQRAFKRIHTHVLGYPKGDKRQFFFAPLALRWMRGDPLPQLIDQAIRYSKSQKRKTSVPTIIRDTMETVEKDLRFRYVKFFTCYNSILELSLKRSGAAQYVAAIPNVPLFLEMGGSSGAMINLMALGLSRTTAEALSVYITDKGIGLDDTKQWLATQKLTQLDISPICLREAEDVATRIRSLPPATN